MGRFGIGRSLVLLGGFVVAVGCFSGGGGGTHDSDTGWGSCQPVYDKLAACGLLVGPNPGVCVRRSPCTQACIVQASCDEVTDWYCSADPLKVIDLSTCWDACSDDYECDDGSGTYSQSESCDGDAVCDDSSDEWMCLMMSLMMCRDGTLFPHDGLCDGVADCPNGDDETYCDNVRCPGSG